MTITQQLRTLNSNIETSQKAKDFCILARIVALSRGRHSDAQQIAADQRLSPTISRILAGPSVYTIDVGARQKASVSAGTTTDSSWALPLAEYDVLAAAFLESLKHFGAFDRMLPQMRRVPLRTRIGASTSGAFGTTVPQGSVKPIGRLALSGGTIDEQKAVAILVVTNELARFGG